MRRRARCGAETVEVMGCARNSKVAAGRAFDGSIIRSRRRFAKAKQARPHCCTVGLARDLSACLPWACCAVPARAFAPKVCHLRSIGEPGGGVFLPMSALRL